MKHRSISRHSVIAVLVVFATVALGNVLTNGLGRPSWPKLAVALVMIGLGVALVMARVRHYAELDELHQRLELEGLAVAFGGSLLVFLAYWVLQVAGLLPPLIGMYYLVGMVALVGVGTEEAWARFMRRPVVQ